MSFVVNLAWVVVAMPACCTRCGLIWSTVVPRRAMRSLIAFWAPLPSASIAMTAATPMTMPSIVSNDLNLFARSDAKATRTISVRSISDAARAQQKLGVTPVARMTEKAVIGARRRSMES